MAQNSTDLNVILMRSTFKIEGKSSVGTVFIMGIPSKKKPEYAYFVLITAAHVLKNMKGEKAVLYLRKKVGNSYEKFPFEVEIRKESKDLWVEHPTVDVSVMYVNLPKGIDISILTVNHLADDSTFQKHQIHPGDELLCLGYPLSYEANEAGFPILRSGKIASFPIIPAKETKSFHFDFEVFPGNSGGPVYFVQSGRTIGRRMTVGTIQFVAGLVSEEAIATQRISTLDEEQLKKYRLSLAKVIHASFIKETIELLRPKE